MRKVLLIAALLLLTGCAGITGTIDNPFGHHRDTGEDPIGWEDGYWWDDSVSVTPTDGYNESEREAVLARAKARVEHTRQQEFESNVTLEVISRAEYRNRSGGPGARTDGKGSWNDQVWEALLLIGEDSSPSQAFAETYNSSVQGFYSPSEDNIVIVSDSPTPRIERATLAHELVHALQDQNGNLGRPANTQDRQLAQKSVTEGEANFVQWQYEDKCESGWECIPDTGGEPSGGAPTDGVFVTIYQPYATGPLLIGERRESSGWKAIDQLHDRPPNSTEQVIHPETYPDEEPVDVTVSDQSTDEWSRYDHDPVADTAGEASIYAMLYINDAIEPETWYRYQSEPSAGWGGDSIVPYKNGSGGYGYVWAIEWDTREDAREFETAYRSILEDRASERPGENVYRLPESDPYGDAFEVTRSGTRVRIVNGPTVESLDEIHG